MKTSPSVIAVMLLIVIGLSHAPAHGQGPQGDRKEAERFFARGTEFYRAGRFKEAVESYARAVKYMTPDAGQLYAMSLAHLQLGRYLEASRLLEQSVRLQPKDTAGLAILGALYTYFGRYDEAEQVLMRANASGGASAEVFNNLGIGYYRRGRSQEAVEAFNAAVKLSPSDAVILHNLSKAYVRLGKTDEAYEAKLRADRIAARKISDTGVILLLNDSIKLELQPSEPRRETSGEPADAEMSTPSSTGSGSDSAAPGTRRTGDADPGTGKASGAGTASPGDSLHAGNGELGAAVEDQKLTSIYRVGEGDVLDIKPKGAAPRGSTLHTVLAGGLLEYPPLGEPVAVAGMTTEEIADKLNAELRRREIGEALSVNTREYVSHTILVSGLVESRGTKILRREAVPLYVIMAEAQPLKEAGRVFVNSYASGRAMEVRLEDIYLEDLLVRPGDVVHVAAAEPEFYYISGKVAGPGEKQFRRGISLSQAIVAGGGRLKTSKSCIVSRAGADGRLVTLRVDLRHLASGVVADPPLQPGDRVEVF